MRRATTIQAQGFRTVTFRPGVTRTFGGDGRSGPLIQIIGDSLAEAAEVGSSDRLLEVAPGNTDAFLPARGRTRRAVAGGEVAWDLPYADGEFDVALSTLAVMSAAELPRAAAELYRVVRPGGRIALAGWTPDGFVGCLLKVMARFMTAPAGLPVPAAWGVPIGMVELLAPTALEIRIRRKQLMLGDPPAVPWIDVFRLHFGSLHDVLCDLGAFGQVALYQALRDLVDEFDRGGGVSLVIPADYLEVVIIK